MSRSTPSPRPPVRPTADDAVRIRFVEAITAADEPFRQSALDADTVAVFEPIAVGGAHAGGDLDVLRLSDARPSSVVDGWLAVAAPTGEPAVEVPVPGGRLHWRTGRAVLLGPVDDRDEVLSGLAAFAFHERTLRTLEDKAAARERQAAADVRLAYRIDDADRDEWPRLGRTMEDLALLRLTFARLEPHLTVVPRSLPPAGRRAFRRLAARAHVEGRLEAVSNRLEACEDLYEGAVDRITDHRWWRRGHRLETIIVVLLAVEGLQLFAELVLHLIQLRGR